MGYYETLRAMQALEEVNDDGVRWLADHVEPLTFEPGARLIVEGDRDRDCYFIVSGTTRVTNGGEVLGETGPGEPEGEMAMIFNRPRAGTTTALDRVETLRLEAADFDGYRVSDPQAAEAFQMAILRHLGRRFGLSTP